MNQTPGNSVRQRTLRFLLDRRKTSGVRQLPVAAVGQNAPKPARSEHWSFRLAPWTAPASLPGAVKQSGLPHDLDPVLTIFSLTEAWIASFFYLTPLLGYSFFVMLAQRTWPVNRANRAHWRGQIRRITD